MSGEIVPYKAEVLKKKVVKRKPIATHLQVHIKGLKGQLGNHIWHIKRIEKDLRAANKLHRLGSVLKPHARGIRPNNV
jgi:hypothetical protein